LHPSSARAIGLPLDTADELGATVKQLQFHNVTKFQDLDITLNVWCIQLEDPYAFDHEKVKRTFGSLAALGKGLPVLQSLTRHLIRLALGCYGPIALHEKVSLPRL
jgi:hypothetical protein